MRILNQKRGNILEIVLPPIIRTIIPLALVMLPLLAYTNSLEDNKTFEKEFLAKEIALTITSLASVPGDAQLSHLPALQGFHVAVKQDEIEVFRENDPLKSSAGFYAPEYITVNQKELYIHEENPEPFIFIKKANTIDLITESEYKENLNGITCDYAPKYAKTSNILIDPGHGGLNTENTQADQGFSANSQIESDMTTILSKILASNPKLKKAQTTRNTNRMLSIEERINKAESNSVETIISIHIGQTSITLYPIKVFFSTKASPETKDLACRLTTALSNILDETSASPLPININDLDEEDPKRILTGGKTAVLIELGNINNQDFIDDFTQKKGEIANAIADTLA